ncbi:MAG: MSHA biogenesis protein MshK [Burkholderiales bacterium]
MKPDYGSGRQRARLAGFCLLLACAAAQAENLPDPTRPAETSEALARGVRSGPVLQSVLISPLRKAAIISGETVQLGGSYGSAKLIKISESEVVLSKGSSLQTLKLFPDIDKTAGQAVSKIK